MTDTWTGDAKALSLDDLLAREASQQTVAGMSACWISNGSIQKASFGTRNIGTGAPATSATLYSIGSLAKVFTAFMICQLVAEGLLHLDDPLVFYVPDFRLAGSDDACAPITIRQLLCHTAAVPDLFQPFQNGQALLNTLAALRPLAAPGEIFSYSNSGYALLGLVLSERTGLPWEANFIARLLDPLRLVNTFAAPPHELPTEVAIDCVVDPDTGVLVTGEMWPRVGQGMAAAGSTLHSTAEDAAWLIAACSTGRNPFDPGAPALLPRELVAEMTRTQVELPGTPLMATGWGLGWTVMNERSHDGSTPRTVGHIGGTSALAQTDPANADVVVLLTNFPTGSELGRRIGAATLGLPCAAEPSKRRGPIGVDLGIYAGRYRSETIDITVRVDDDGGLWMLNPLSGRDVPIYHLDGESFRTDLGAIVTEVTFIRNDAGGVIGMHTALRLLARIIEQGPSSIRSESFGADAHAERQ
jgi:CubicO group peptidase (beta-lactamase class C family)